MGHMGSVCTRGWGSVGQLVGRSIGDDGFLDPGPGGRGWGAEGVGVGVALRMGKVQRKQVRR